MGIGDSLVRHRWRASPSDSRLHLAGALSKDAVRLSSGDVVAEALGYGGVTHQVRTKCYRSAAGVGQRSAQAGRSQGPDSGSVGLFGLGLMGVQRMRISLSR
jgi:hypothetical protein